MGNSTEAEEREKESALKYTVISVQVSREFDDVMELIVEKNTHRTKSELMRAALRAYLMEHYPAFMQRFMQPSTTEPTARMGADGEGQAGVQA